MKDKIINNAIGNISKNYNYDSTKLKEIKFGLETLYLTITKFIVITILSLIFNVFKEFLLFTLSYGLLKVTAFGMHAKKTWQCYLTSIPIFIVIPYLIKNIVLPNILIYISLPIFLVLICIYAPADTEKRPLINKKKRLIYKILTILTSSIYTCIILIVKDSYLTSLLYYSLMLQTIIINPISYKLFGLRYRNYLSYKSERR